MKRKLAHCCPISKSFSFFEAYLAPVILFINPTPVRGAFSAPPPGQKMAITPENQNPKELKLCDFSYISLTNPPIPFFGLKMAKKGGFRAFLLSAVLIFGS